MLTDSVDELITLPTFVKENKRSLHSGQTHFHGTLNESKVSSDVDGALFSAKQSTHLNELQSLPGPAA